MASRSAEADYLNNLHSLVRAQARPAGRMRSCWLAPATNDQVCRAEFQNCTTSSANAKSKAWLDFAAALLGSVHYAPCSVQRPTNHVGAVRAV